MRYTAAIEIRHLAQGDPLAEAGRTALETNTVAEFNRANAKVTLLDVRLAPRPDGVFVLHATMAGREFGNLTSPLVALTKLDEALLEALAATGLFEEFDVARRRLEVWPDPVR